MKTALEQLEQLEAEHQQKIAAIRESAVSELSNVIGDLKKKLKDAEEQYIKLTGKRLDGSSATEPKKEKGKRDRWTDDQKADLKQKVYDFLKAAKSPVKMADIVDTLKVEKKRISDAILTLDDKIKKDGKRVNMTYSLK